MSTFRTAVTSNPECGIRFYLKIQGIPHIFLDGPTPVGPDGSAWAAPTSGGYGYTLQPNTIADQAFEDIGPEISRSTSDISPAAMTIELQETSAAALLELFARDLSTGNRTNLTASFGYDDASPPAAMTVEDTTGWASSGHIYFGRETIRYQSTTPTTFGTLTRDLFSIGDADSVYVHNDIKPSPAPRLVTDYPRVWRGRYVQLFAFVVDADGRAYDGAFDGAYSQEIWRGVLSSNPSPGRDWHSWTLQTDSIEAIMSTTVGPKSETIGTMLRVAGGVDANKSGEVPWQTPEGGQPTFWLDENTRYLHVRIVENSGGAITELDLTEDNAVDIGSGGAAPGIAQAQGLALLIQTNVNSAISGTFPDLTMRVWWSPEQQRFAYTWKNSSASKEYEAEVEWERQGSVGYLVGFVSYYQHHVDPGTETVAALSTVELLAAYIHPHGTTIPFFYEDSDDLSTPSPPQPGFAVVGEEVVRYDSIQAATYLDGMYQLTGCERGRMGTVATEHMVKLSEEGEEHEIRFGVGFESEGVATASKATSTDALMQLAISTGEGHHGSFDTLPGSVSVPLNPNHFDTGQWDEKIVKLPGQQRWIDYIIHESETLGSIAASLLQPLGLIPYGGLSADDGTYKVRLARILGYLEAESATTVDESSLRQSDPAEHMSGSDKLINEIKVRLWDVVRAEVGERYVVLTDDDSSAEHGERSGIEWTLRGYRFASLSDAEIKDAISQMAIGVFRRFSQPYDLFRVSVGRGGWFVSPGESVLITMSGIPTSAGARGMTDRPAVVLQASKRFNGGEPGADLVCIVESEVRRSSYVPSGTISGYTAGVPSITIDAHSYSSTGADIDHFEVGDWIWVYKELGDATRDLRQIDAISSNTITLSSALSWTPVAGAPITGADYGTVVASQRKHAHMADGSTPPALSVTDTTAFKYIA